MRKYPVRILLFPSGIPVFPHTARIDFRTTHPPLDRALCLWPETPFNTEVTLTLSYEALCQADIIKCFQDLAFLLKCSLDLWLALQAQVLTTDMCKCQCVSFKQLAEIVICDFCHAADLFAHTHTHNIFSFTCCESFQKHSDRQPWGIRWLGWKLPSACFQSVLIRSFAIFHVYPSN